MYANRTADAIARHWQRVIESDLETGATTLLHAGRGPHLISGAATLDALQALSARRDDTAQPVAIAGGSNALWPAALFAPQPQHTRPAAVAPVVLFGGDEPATGLALMATWVDGLPPSPYVRHTNVYHLFDPTLIPARHPGGAITWDMTPFAVATDESTPAAHEDTTDPDATWMAWAVLVLVLFLPLLAMFI